MITLVAVLVVVLVTIVAVGRAMAQAPRKPGFDPGSVHVGFVVDKVAM